MTNKQEEEKRRNEIAWKRKEDRKRMGRESEGHPVGKWKKRHRPADLRFHKGLKSRKKSTGEGTNTQVDEKRVERGARKFP